MLEAVLELSQEEAGALDQPPLEDEPTSSPDTGFGDTEAHDLASNTNLLEPDTRQPTGSVEVCLPSPRHIQITGPLRSPWVLNLESPLSHPLYSLSLAYFGLIIDALFTCIEGCSLLYNSCCKSSYNTLYNT